MMMSCSDGKIKHDSITDMAQDLAILHRNFTSAFYMYFLSAVFPVLFIFFFQSQLYFRPVYYVRIALEDYDIYYPDISKNIFPWVRGNIGFTFSEKYPDFGMMFIDSAR